MCKYMYPLLQRPFLEFSLKVLECKESFCHLTYC
eukprot:UN20983